MSRNLFVERNQFPMGYPHSPGANLPRVFQSSFSGLGGTAGGCGCSGLGAPKRQVSLGRALGAIAAPALMGLGSNGDPTNGDPTAAATQDALAADDAGFAADAATTDLTVQSYGTSTSYSLGVRSVMYALGVAGTAVGAYHGYKRNRGSIGWAIGWALLGGLFPVIVVPVALAQGLGKRGR